VIVVHHLNNSRSQRILWLLEELGLGYEVKRYGRDPRTMLVPPVPAEVAAVRAGRDASRPQLVSFLERIHARCAYRRALERGGRYEILR
jgi:glutathione S-transferase